MKRVDEWQRVHRTPQTVRLRAVASPIGTRDWLLRVDGWDLPEHHPLLYESLEAAQRAADDVLVNYQPHDCRLNGCWGMEAGRDPDPRHAGATHVAALPDEAVLRPS